MGRLARSAVTNFYFGTPLCISEANQPKKLRFGGLVGIYRF